MIRHRFLENVIIQKCHSFLESTTIGNGRLNIYICGYLVPNFDDLIFKIDANSFYSGKR